MGTPQDVARRHDDAWNEKDFEAREDCCSPDLELEMPGGMSFRGIDLVKQMENAFWTALPDSQVKSTAVYVDGDTVIAEGALTGTHTGPFVTPQGTIPPSGNTVSLRYASVKRIADGKLVAEHLYFDQMEFLGQLGALPGPTA